MLFHDLLIENIGRDSSAEKQKPGQKMLSEPVSQKDRKVRLPFLQYCVQHCHDLP